MDKVEKDSTCRARRYSGVSIAPSVADVCRLGGSIEHDNAALPTLIINGTHSHLQVGRYCT